MRNSNILLIFDCFGVVVHTASEVWVRMFPNSDEKIEEALKIFNTGDKGLATFDETISNASKLFNANPEETKRIWRELAKPLELVDYLPILKEKYAIELLSNATDTFLESLFLKYNLYPLFDEMVISYKEGITKPDIEIFNLALKRMNKTYDKVLFFDDNPINVEAACKAGIKGILYTDFETFKNNLDEYLK